MARVCIILKYLFFANIENGVLLPCRLSLSSSSVVCGSLNVFGKKVFVLSSSVSTEQCTSYTVSVTLDGEVFLLVVK